MPTGLEEVAAIMGISVEEVQKGGLRAFLEKELRATRAEILATYQKYGVRSWEGMNQLIVEDTIYEGYSCLVHARSLYSTGPHHRLHRADSAFTSASGTA